MRDQRFIAAHRGGPLDIKRHRLLARWAADCAEHLIHHFKLVSDDARPLHAIELAREWAKGNVSTGACMKASVAAHAAARAVHDPAAVAAARAAGHAVATAHFAEHALGPIVYGQKTMLAAGESATRELAWQKKKLPAAVRELVLSALEHPKFTAKRKPPT